METRSLLIAKSNYNKLIEALKFRFLHLLDRIDKINQVEILLERTELEVIRFQDLRSHHGSENGFLKMWLDRDIKVLEDRLDWLLKLKNTL